MLKIQSVKEENLNFSKDESQKPKKDIISPKKIEEKNEENYDSDISQTNKTSPNSSTGSNCDSINKCNQNKCNDISNSFTDEKETLSTKCLKKNLFQNLNYFQYNEKYFQDKMPEQNNYKKNSKNFIKKNAFNKETKIDNIDQNNVNTILKNIENVQKNFNNCVNNVNMVNSNININFEDIDILSLNQFSNPNNRAFFFNNNLFLSKQMNYNIFDFRSN